jgi:hypothetical protein
MPGLSCDQGHRPKYWVQPAFGVGVTNGKPTTRCKAAKNDQCENGEKFGENEIKATGGLYLGKNPRETREEEKDLHSVM